MEYLRRYILFKSSLSDRGGCLKMNGFLRRGGSLTFCGITRTIAALTIWRQSNPRLDASFEAPLALLGSK